MVVKRSFQEVRIFALCYLLMFCLMESLAHRRIQSLPVQYSRLSQEFCFCCFSPMDDSVIVKGAKNRQHLLQHPGDCWLAQSSLINQLSKVSSFHVLEDDLEVALIFKWVKTAQDVGVCEFLNNLNPLRISSQSSSLINGYHLHG